MQLNRGAEDEYRQRHNPIWKELEEVLRSNGVHNYSNISEVIQELLEAFPGL